MQGILDKRNLNGMDTFFEWMIVLSEEDLPVDTGRLEEYNSHGKTQVMDFIRSRNMEEVWQKIDIFGNGYGRRLLAV